MRKALGIFSRGFFVGGQGSGLRHFGRMRRGIILAVLAFLGAGAMTGCKIPRPPPVPGPIQPPAPPGTRL
jgi:hypothetical protein